MASKITLVFLISVTVTLLVVSYFLLKQKRVEGFTTQGGYSVESLEINTCPPYASEIQTAKGSTDCCQGDMVDGKCNGTTFCTKSPAYKDVPSCIDKWREYFKDKGNNFCPPTMSNYYEDITNGSAPKGCSAGPISKDGKVPLDGTAKQCKVYASEENNKTWANSCYIEKLRAKVQCPVVNGQSPEATLYLDDRDKTKFGLIQCQYPFELGMPTFCAERSSLEQYFTRLIPNWRTNSRLDENVKMYACENYIARREAAQTEANRLQVEEKKRQEAEAKAKKEAEARAAAEANAKKRADEASRLQQQLDEANRQLQSCKK
jgi:hypothetical protein